MRILLVLAVASIVLFSGCAAPVKRPAPVVQPIVQPDGPVLAYGAPVRLGAAPLAPTKQPVARRGWVQFDTASAKVSDASVIELRKTARFLRNHPAVNVLIEGNCDERGSYPYNQRLGAARAESVAKVLTDSGVSANRVATASNGEFKPLLKCHAEKCWAMNRRVDVIYGW